MRIAAILVVVIVIFTSAVIADSKAELKSYYKHAPKDKCTSIAVTPGASLDGSAMTTHTNDCADCDFRIGVVPGKVQTRSQRPVAPARFAYPRYIGDDRGPTFTADMVTDKQFPWGPTKPNGFIAEVEKTLSYIDGSYALINEHQVAFGESTCSARLVNVPIFDGGKALFDISDLSRVALERARTAREAVKLMGTLGEQYGYYGAEWKGGDAFGEAGESLTVADGKEVWIFHMLPDDTGAGAVWAAQRVPDGHVTVVANEFIIKEINLDDPDNFLASANVHAVALRNKFWDPKQGPFNFRQAYRYAPFHVHAEYADRRNWRVMSLVAPHLKLTPNMTIDDLPFSVKPQKPISLRDVFRFNRDHYEGTEFDLTKGIAAGPFGNPNRYDAGWASGVPVKLLVAGNFERAISIHRTAYSTVTQSRAWLPDVVGGKVWFGNAHPHSTQYIPIYGAASAAPAELMRGSLYKFDSLSNWWAMSAVGNWMEKSYVHIVEDVSYEQYTHEINLLKEAAQFEADVVNVVNGGTPAKAVQMVTDYHLATATKVTKDWYDLFYFLIAKYKDGARIDDFHAETFDPNPLFYPFEWLKHTTYWDGADEKIRKEAGVLPAAASAAHKTAPVIAPASAPASGAGAEPVHAPAHEGGSGMVVSGVLMAVVYAAGVFTGRRFAAKGEYSAISSDV